MTVQWKMFIVRNAIGWAACLVILVGGVTFQEGWCLREPHSGVWLPLNGRLLFSHLLAVVYLANCWVFRGLLLGFPGDVSASLARETCYLQPVMAVVFEIAEIREFADSWVQFNQFGENVTRIQPIVMAAIVGLGSLASWRVWRAGAGGKEGGMGLAFAASLSWLAVAWFLGVSPNLMGEAIE